MGAHQHVHKGYLSPRQQPAAAGVHAFYCDSVELGGTPVGGTFPLASYFPHLITLHAGQSWLLCYKGVRGERYPYQGHPFPASPRGLLQVLRLVAGRGTGNRGHCGGGLGGVGGGWTDGQQPRHRPQG